MLTLSIAQEIAIWVLPVLFSITLHEAAHAYAAKLCGDTTAKMMGRLTLNPLRHIDLVGTIIVPIFIGILTKFQFIFGWAKPVPISWNQLRNPRRDMALVGLAGPFANLFMATLWAAGLKLSTLLNPESSSPVLFLFLTSQAGVLINLILAFLNLIPIPPLDGSRLVAGILPPRQSIGYLRLEPYGFIILFALLFTGIVNWLINPFIGWSSSFLQWLFNL